MPQLKRWIVAKKLVNIFPEDVLKKLVELGANFGGGWNEIHQHINVSPQNREQIVELLEKAGYEVEEPSSYSEVVKTDLSNHK
ncbi:MAG TPA: hypothetical protein PLM75_13160 [bacterium]|nr:hypothetical protein [bacterium]HPP88799.1 hypothetical protein [bacterium]